jgi:hypothetical protein
LVSLNMFQPLCLPQMPDPAELAPEVIEAEVLAI